MCVQGVGGGGAHFLTKCFVHVYVCKLFIHLVVVHITLGKWGLAFSNPLGTFSGFAGEHSVYTFG